MNSSGKGRTSLKRRIISGLLVFAMVASLLPAGLVIPARAANTNYPQNGTLSLKVESDGTITMTATFTGIGGNANNGGIGPYSFVIVPDISSRGTSNAPSNMFGGSLGYSTSDLPGWCSTNNTPVLYSEDNTSSVKHITNPTNFVNGTVTFTGIELTKTFDTALSEWADHYRADGKKVSEAPGSIPLIALFYQKQGDASLSSTTSTTWAGKKLIISPDTTVKYKYGANSTAAKWNIDPTTNTYGGQWAGGTTYATVYFQVTNATGKKITIKGTGTTNDKYRRAVGIESSSLDKEISFADASVRYVNNNAVPTANTGSYTMESNAAPMTLAIGLRGRDLQNSPSGEITFYVRYEDESNEEGFAYVTVTLEPIVAYWTGDNISFSVDEGYTPSATDDSWVASGSRETVLTWHTEDDPVDFGPSNASLRDENGDFGGTVNWYYIDGSGAEIEITDANKLSLTNGQEVILRVTPKAGIMSKVTPNSTDGPFVRLTNTTPNKDVTITIDVNLDTKYTVTATAGDGAASATVNGGATAEVVAGNNATLAATAATGYNPSTLAWTKAPATSTSVISGNTITVNDDVTVTASYTIYKPTLSVTTNVTTAGGSDGTLKIGNIASYQTSGAVPSNLTFTFLKSDGTTATGTVNTTTGVITGVSAGKYKVRVTDSTTGQTSDSDEVTVTEPGKATVTIKLDGVAQSGVSVTATPTTGTAFTKTTNGSGVATFDQLASGNYTISFGSTPQSDWKVVAATSRVISSGNDLTMEFYTVSTKTSTSASSVYLDNTLAKTSGVYQSGTTYTATAVAASGYGGNATWTAGKPATGATAGTASGPSAATASGTASAAVTVTGTTELTATFTPNPITGSDKSINWTYGDSRTETWAPASCAGATVSYALKSGQTFPKWLEASGVMTVDNANGLKIVGRPNKIGTTSIVVVATSDNGADPIELTYTITVGQHNPNITLTDTGNPHYVTDPASGAVTTTFSGPYYTGDPDDEYKSGKWVDLDQDSAAAALTQTYTSNGNSGLTANASPNQSKANVKLDLEVPATGHENKALALSVVWTAVSSNKDVTLSASYNVNVEVKVDAGLDNNGYTDVTISGGSLAAPKTATLSGGKATFTGIPNGATYTVKLGTNGPSESVKVDSGDKTVTFQYWNLKLSSAANGSAAYDSTGTGYVSADGIYYTGTKFKIVATPTPGYSFDQWKALNDTTNLNGNKSATVDTTLTAKTDIQATFTANPVTATITNLAGNYGDDYTTTKKTVVAIGATGVASEAFTFTPKTGNPPLPGGLTLETGTNADGTGYIRVTGRPYEIVSTARSYTYTVTSKNGASKDVTFTVKIDKLSTTITVADNGSAHYKTDPSNGAVTVTVNGNNSTGKPYYDGSDWKSLTGTTILADSSVTYTPNTLTTAPTTSVTVNIGAYEEKTGSPLTDVWSTVSASGDVTVKTSANVTVNVTLNDGNYPAMKGKTVYLKQGTTTVSYGVLGDDTSSPVAKQTTAISKVPTDSTAYDVYIDTVKITGTTVLVNDETAKTVNVAYYTYKFDANKPTDATGAVDLKGAPTTDQTVLSGYSLGIPTTPTLPGYTFKGWSLNDSTSTDGSWDSGSQTINSGARTYYATWAVNPLSLGDGNYSATYGVAIPNGTALAKKPTVTKPDGSDTITYKVGDGAATPTWGSSHTIDGITLTVDTTNGGWTISGTPTQYGTGSVVFDIQVTSTLTKQTKTNKVTVTIAKAQIDTVDVTDIKVPTPGIAVTSIPTADLPTTDPGYGDDTDGKYGDEEATVTWKQGSTTVTTGNFEYGKAYTAEVIVKPDGNHEFADKVTTNATPTGGTTEIKTNVAKNADGTVTVTYTFPAVYQLKYSPNGGSGGTQPADQDIKLNDKITIATDPGYTRSGWKGSKGWAVTSGGGVDGTYGTFGATNVTVTQAMLNRATNGVVTLYYVWESSAMGTPEVQLDAVYNMDNTQWKTGDVNYWTRTYENLVAPGVISVTGEEVALENLSYTLEKIDSGFDPNTYFKVDVDGTSHLATMSMKDGVKIPAVGTYTFTVKVVNNENNQEASNTYTLNVRPIELDHSALSALTAPVKDATPATTVTKTDVDTNWSAFYNTSSVSWSPSHDPYKKGQSYTATITLTPVSTNYIFVKPDDNSNNGAGDTAAFMVGTEKVIDPSDTGWSYELAKTKVTMTRVYPLTAIEVEATLTATAWNTLTVTDFKAQTQSNVNLYYLIYDSAQTFADAAAVRTAYTSATAGSGGVIAKGTKADVKPTSGTAAWGSTITVTDNGIVGDHTYYLYVLAEAVSDNSVLATNDDTATTPKKLTLTHNGYGKVEWTTGSSDPKNTPAGPLAADTLTGSYTATTANKSQVISMFQDSTFTATPDDTGKFGFVKWTLKKATDDDPADVPAGTPATEYKYKASGEGANTNDETLHAIFHRKINGSFKIAEVDAGGGDKTYSANLSENNLRIGAVTKTNLSTEGGITYQWQVSKDGVSSPQAGNDAHWDNISGETNATYTNPAGSYAGKSFRLVIYYTDPDNGGAQSSVAAATGKQTQKLSTPQPDLELVESTVTDKDFPKMAGGNVDKNQGGLHMTLPIISQDDQDGDPVAKYTVILKKNGTQVDTYDIVPATTKAVEVDGVKYYYKDWPADLTKIKPGDSFTVEVKAVAKTDSGWLDSDTGTDTAEAGFRTLTRDDLKGTFTDKVFNGTTQTGGTVTAPTGAGAVTIKYAATRPDGDPSSKEINKTHVNIEGDDDDIKPEYDVYVSVAKGTLYLAYPESLYTTANAATDNTDWKITQAPVNLTIPTVAAKVQVSQTLTPTVTYTTGGSSVWGTNSGNTGTITSYYDVTYSDVQLNGVAATASTDGGLTGDYILTLDTTNPSIATFTPLVQGTFTIKAKASYKDTTSKQFKADLAEKEETISISTAVRTVKSIVLKKWDAVNGVVGGADINPDRTVPDTTVTYGTGVNADTTDGAEGRYIADTAANAKQMRMNGLQLIITYDTNAVDTYIIGDDEYSSNGTTLAYNGNLPSGFEWFFGGSVDSGTSTAGTNKAMTFTGAGSVTVGVKETKANGEKSNTVTYTMQKRPLDYTVTSDIERVWSNGNAKVTGTVSSPVPANLTGDDVKIVLDTDQFVTTNVKYATWVAGGSVPYGADAAITRNSDVGKDKLVRAVTKGTSGSGADVTGAQAAFYKRGQETPGKASITPRKINTITLTVDKTTGVEPGKLISAATVKVGVHDGEGNRGLEESNPINYASNKIKWQILKDGGDPTNDNDWEDPVDATFLANRKYRVTVDVKANTNHYLEKNDGYTLNGYHDGQLSDDDNKFPTKVTVADDPYHPDWLTGDENSRNVLYWNKGQFQGILDLTVTPELQFADFRSSGYDFDNYNPSSAHHPFKANTVHIESATLGASLGKYYIDMRADVLSVWDVSVANATGNLLDMGAVLTPLTDTKRDGEMRAREKDDMIRYELDLTGVSTATPGEYILTLTAKGSAKEGTKANDINASYTFALVVSQAQQVERPQPPADNSVVVLYWVSLKGKTNDLTGEKLSAGGSPTFVPDVIGLDGYVFKGWSETDPTLLKDGEKPTLVDPKTFSIRADKIFYAYYEKEGIDHTHYVVGYKDGTFQPNANITRAEVATIIARACLEGFEEGKDYGNPGNYSDVGAKKWYASAIAYTTMAGVFSGYKDGTFRPNEPITRQEFASVIGRMAGLLVNQGLPFEDASSVSKWARDGVYTVYKHGWVTGYTDNTFQPQGYLTRAEAVRVFNGYLNRGVDAEGLKGMTPYLLDAAAGGYESDGSSQYLTWSDVPERHWAYHDILEASNDHDFHWPDKKDSNEKKDTPPEAWDKVYLDEQWRYRREFAVTFDLAGLGTTMAPTSVKVVENGAIKIAPTVTPVDGYTFLGWSETDPALGEEIVLVAPTAIAITADKTYYAVYEETRTEPKTYNVLFEVGRNGVLNGWPTVTVEENTVPTVSTVTADEGYAFLGWSETDPALGEEVTLVDPAAIAITADKTYYAVYKEVQIEPETYSVLFVAGENGALNEWPLLKVEANTAPAVPAVTANEGYTFLGWVEVDPAKGETVALVDPAAIAITANKTYYAVYEERQPEPEVPGQLYVHKAYFDGREEGRFDPKTAVTRAEVAAMLVRGWATDYDENTVYDVSGLSDIAADHPYRNFIGYCLENGIFSGYKDGTFDPDGSINRQEFASVLARLAGIQTNQGLPFTDADTIKKWARDAIYTVYVNGWMTGYADGTFRPKNEVTRAEAVRAFNNFLGRTLTREGIANVTEFDHIWTDVKVTNWAYLDIMEATHTHTYYILNGVEYWVDATDVDLAAVESDHTEVADEETPEGEPADQGAPEEGSPEEGVPEEGTPEEETPEGEVPEEGSSEEGTSDEESTQG